MLGKFARLVLATITAITVAAGIAMVSAGSAAAAARNAPSVALYTVAKPPPCKRCCLKMNNKTHRCAKYGYHRGKGKCAAKCK